MVRVQDISASEGEHAEVVAEQATGLVDEGTLAAV